MDLKEKDYSSTGNPPPRRPEPLAYRHCDVNELCNRIAALKAENARLTALVMDAEEFAESGANDSEASEEWKSDCRDFLSRAKAELEGR